MSGWLGLELDIGEQIKFSRLLGEIGKRKDSCPWQLLIGLKRKEDKELLLDNAHKLAKAPEPWNFIGLSPDLTRL